MPAPASSSAGSSQKVCDWSARMVHADGGVNRQNQRAIGNPLVAPADGTQHRQAEGRQHHAAEEQPAMWKQGLHRKRGADAAQQCQNERLQATMPVVVGFCQCTSHDAKEKRHHARHLIE